MSGIVHTGPPVYVNADRSKVVPESSPEAAFLMVGQGGTVDREFVALYREHFGPAAADATDSEKPHTVTFGKPTAEVTPKPAGGDVPADAAVEVTVDGTNENHTAAVGSVEVIEVSVGETGELPAGADGESTDPIVNLDDLDRAQLLAYADEHGIGVNRRLGEVKLREAISEAPLPPAVGGLGEQEA